MGKWLSDATELTIVHSAKLQMFDDKSCNISSSICDEFKPNYTAPFFVTIPMLTQAILLAVSFCYSKICKKLYVTHLCFKLHPIHDMFNDTALSNLSEQSQKKFNIINSHIDDQKEILSIISLTKLMQQEKSTTQE